LEYGVKYIGRSVVLVGDYLLLNPTSEIDDLPNVFFQPNQRNNTFSENISPNPNITPLTNGRTRLIVSDPSRAITRVFVDREESKTDRDAGGFGCWCDSREGCWS
jgi:hypothetical protein